MYSCQDAGPEICGRTLAPLCDCRVVGSILETRNYTILDPRDFDSFVLHSVQVVNKTDVVIGDILAVRAGDQIPVDGIVSCYFLHSIFSSALLGQFTTIRIA